LIVNEQSSRFDNGLVDKLIKSIRDQEGQYSIFHPESATAFFETAQAVCGNKRLRRRLPQNFERRGKVTGVIACGGDGSFNLCAREALVAGIPVGVLPLGRFNDIAHGLYGDTTPETAMTRILGQTYGLIDVGTIGDQRFFGSIGLGLIPCMAHQLSQRKRPRFAIGWKSVAAKAVANVKSLTTEMKVDAFRFEAESSIINVNLLPYTLGMPLTPSSLPDDHHAEIIFDVGISHKEIASYIRLICKKRYLYGGEVRLYRGSTMTLQPAQGRVLYLDGELIELPDNVIQIDISKQQLKVFR
jgi:diacylglycerol kinase family enzyme